MLNQNLLHAKYGLVNGSRGKVIDILYDDNNVPDKLPKCVIVEFKGYKGPSLFKNHPTWVPIIPFTATLPNRVSKRTQIPLDLAYAITIHKSQGLSLDRAVIDLGSRENNEGGLTYVALSRLRTFDGLFLKPCEWSRLEQINRREMIKIRIEEEKITISQPF